MTLQELLARLNITKTPIRNTNGSYTIDLDDSNMFSIYYSKLNKANFLDMDDEASQFTEDITQLQYFNDDFVLTLLGNLNDENDYKLIIREV